MRSIVLTPLSMLRHDKPGCLIKKLNRLQLVSETFDRDTRHFCATLGVAEHRCDALAYTRLQVRCKPRFMNN